MEKWLFDSFKNFRTDRNICAHEAYEILNNADIILGRKHYLKKLLNLNWAKRKIKAS